MKSEQCVYPLKDVLLQFASDHEQRLAEQATDLLDDSATLETPSGYAYHDRAPAKTDSGLHLVRETIRNSTIRCETLKGETRWCVWVINRLAEYASSVISV